MKKIINLDNKIHITNGREKRERESEEKLIIIIPAKYVRFFPFCWKAGQKLMYIYTHYTNTYKHNLRVYYFRLCAPVFLCFSLSVSIKGEKTTKRETRKKSFNKVTAQLK